MSKRFILIFLLVHILGLELFSWILNYLSCEKNPALLHPQLLWDFLYASIFYFGLALGWAVLFTRFRFRLREVFLIQGLVGVLLEQQGGIIISLFQNIPAGILIALYVFAVYGGAAFLSGYLFMKWGGKLGETSKHKNFLLKFLISIVVLLFFVVVFSLLINTIPALIPISTERYPICERPFF